MSWSRIIILALPVFLAACSGHSITTSYEPVAPTWLPAPALTMPAAPPAATPLQRLAGDLGALGDNALTTMLAKDAADTLAWVNGPEWPATNTAIQKAEALACPTAVNLALADLKTDVADAQKAILALDAKLSGVAKGDALAHIELILLNTKLRYGAGPSDPLIQAKQTVRNVIERVSFAVHQCALTVPVQKINAELGQVAKLAGAAGLIGTGAGAPLGIGMLVTP